MLQPILSDSFDEQTPGLNVITEYIMGYVYPGRPVANMCFKVYGYISMKQALSFLQDFKLGHYMKIPPRTMFMAQVRLLYPPLLPSNFVALSTSSFRKGNDVGAGGSSYSCFFALCMCLLANLCDMRRTASLHYACLSLQGSPSDMDLESRILVRLDCLL